MQKLVVTMRQALSGAIAMIAVSELLRRAKQAIESGETSLQAAAEDLAAAQERGATQRQIAEAVGKSAGWVNRLLKWRVGGFSDGTAFGPQAKASRQRARRVQSTERQKRATTSEQVQAATTRARAETAKAEAAKAKADAQKAKAEAAKAKAEARRASARLKFDFFRDAFGSRKKKTIHSGPRDLLVKALGMLGSDQPGERANAALVVENQRAKLDMTWDELIIGAEEAESRAA
jgi:hypothetical protein